MLQKTQFEYSREKIGQMRHKKKRLKQNNMANDPLSPVEALLVVQRDEEQHRAHLEALRAQIAAGTYQVNSVALAQSLLESPVARKALGIE